MIKPSTELLGLSDKSEATLRNKLSEVEVLSIDDFPWYLVIYGQILQL